MRPSKHLNPVVNPKSLRRTQSPKRLVEFKSKDRASFDFSWAVSPEVPAILVLRKPGQKPRKPLPPPPPKAPFLGNEGFVVMNLSSKP